MEKELSPEEKWENITIARCIEIPIEHINKLKQQIEQQDL